jgi:hypothetical protein
MGSGKRNHSPSRFIGGRPGIIRSELSNDFDVITADLGSAYGETLHGYTRTLLYRKNGLDLQVFGSGELVATSEGTPLLLNQFVKSESAPICRVPILSYAIAQPSQQALFVSVLFSRRSTDAPGSSSVDPNGKNTSCGRRCDHIYSLGF